MYTNYMRRHAYKYAAFRHILGFKKSAEKILPVAPSEAHDTKTVKVMGSIPREYMYGC